MSRPLFNLLVEVNVQIKENIASGIKLQGGGMLVLRFGDDIVLFSGKVYMEK